jgi:hypothetical protein
MGVGMGLERGGERRGGGGGGGHRHHHDMDFLKEMMHSFKLRK